MSRLDGRHLALGGVGLLALLGMARGSRNGLTFSVMNVTVKLAGAPDAEPTPMPMPVVVRRVPGETAPRLLLLPAWSRWNTVVDQSRARFREAARAGEEVVTWLRPSMDEAVSALTHYGVECPRVPGEYVAQKPDLIGPRVLGRFEPRWMVAAYDKPRDEIAFRTKSESAPEGRDEDDRIVLARSIAGALNAQALSRQPE
jgi:hypothetical protein